MPIHCPLSIRDVSPAEFDVVDAVVMKHAYACHNDLGRLCDEFNYENDLAIRLRSIGMDVHTQVPIQVTHSSFEKTYRLDLVCNQVVYDAKTVQAIVGSHVAQVLNYAMLLDVCHIKLLNFRPSKLEGQLKYNSLSTQKRHHFKLDASQWVPLSSDCDALKQCLVDLLNDWGAFLSTNLYSAALNHFFGDGSQTSQRVDLVRSGYRLGSHVVNQYHPGIHFIVSAVTRDQALYKTHLQRLHKLTGLRGLQWINLQHDEIRITTIQ